MAFVRVTGCFIGFKKISNRVKYKEATIVQTKQSLLRMRWDGPPLSLQANCIYVLHFLPFCIE